MKKNKTSAFNKATIPSLLIITFLLIVSIPPPLEAGPPFKVFVPKYIYGTAIRCDTTDAYGATVIATATGLPDENGVVDSGGGWSLDISGDGGQTEWPDGTIFNLEINMTDDWSGNITGMVNGHTDIGEITLYPPELIADAGTYTGYYIIGETINFFGSATGGCGDYQWEWDFGDSTSHSYEQNPSHIYTTAGTFTVDLTVTDCCDLIDNDIVYIEIVNQNPVADAGGPYRGTANCGFVQFHGSATGGITPYSWEWDFGDSSPHSYEQNPIHTYTNPGDYTATLTVTDYNTNTGTDTSSVYIESSSTLNAEAGGPYEGVANYECVWLQGTASGGCQPYTWEWDFGDGTTNSLERNPCHTYTSTGQYTATITVTDINMISDSDTTTIRIYAQLQAEIGGPYRGIIDEVVTFHGSATNGKTPYTYTWDLDNDGNYDDYTGENPSKSWDTPGMYTISLKVTDDMSNSDTDETTVTITTPNPPNKPNTPQGKTSGKTGEEYNYQTSTTDPNGNQIFYKWDWGDEITEWDGPYDSGETITASHIWNEQGDYQIKVKAKNTYDKESEWSDPLSISMPKNKITNPIITLLEKFIQHFPIIEKIITLICKIIINK